MTPDVINSRLRARPFAPFRVHVSDGSAYKVRSAEFMFVSRREVVTGIDVADDGLPERSIHVDPVHATRIELLTGAG